jgi:PadR family transcriptional regulator PadR
MPSASERSGHFLSSRWDVAKEEVPRFYASSVWSVIRRARNRCIQALNPRIGNLASTEIQGLNSKSLLTRPPIPVDSANEYVVAYLQCPKERAMGEGKSEVLQGTLDLMVLKTLYAMGPLHGFGIARRIEQVSDGVLDLNEGTVYTALLRLQQQGWIVSKWGTSENNRRARFYSITKLGAKQLERETENWERMAGVMQRLLKLERLG